MAAPQSGSSPSRPIMAPRMTANANEALRMPET